MVPELKRSMMALPEYHIIRSVKILPKCTLSLIALFCFYIFLYFWLFRSAMGNYCQGVLL